MNAPAFKIRGHHLGLFAQVASGQRTPDELAGDKVARYTWLARNPSIARDIPEDKEYAEDIIGKSAAGATVVQRRIAAVFNKFMELQPDDLVTITTTARDNYCQSCMVGNHCVDRGPELAMIVGGRALQIYKYEIADMYGVSNFIKLGEQLALSGRIDPELATLYRHNDSETQPSEDALSIFSPEAGLPAPGHISYQVPITANAGYVKAVLSNWG